jgi:hypothetical protein
MSFINFPSPTPIFPVLPPLAWSVHKKPILGSREYIAASGREVQLATAVYPRWAFTLTYGGNSWLRDQTQNIVPDFTLAGFTELQQISQLFLACRGAYGEFFYSDPEDNSRKGQVLGTYTGNITSTYIVMSTWGSGPFSPNLSFPVGSVNVLSAVYVGGNLVSPTDYSLDATGTKLNISTRYSGTLTIDFSFYYRCRFLDDYMNYSQFAQNLWETKEVRFESVKP